MSTNEDIGYKIRKYVLDLFIIFLLLPSNICFGENYRFVFSWGYGLTISLLDLSTGPIITFILDFYAYLIVFCFILMMILMVLASYFIKHQQIKVAYSFRLIEYWVILMFVSIWIFIFNIMEFIIYRELFGAYIFLPILFIFLFLKTILGIRLGLRLTKEKLNEMHSQNAENAQELETKFCSHCGKKIKNDAEFCEYCGGKQEYTL
jgi:hypothetical protein